ncbi:MAG: elongation factor G [Pirellulaceae bacterium]|nr:MAG: elongation factor G [Pirellulaceae bacterium]
MTSHVAISQRRNVAFCGHSSVGKTTLIDTLLQVTGAVDGAHSVDDGTSICDFDPEEKHHKHTIEAKVVHCEHDGNYITMLDTPGYVDFIGQTIGALAAADAAAVCINAHKGIEVNTRRVFKEASTLRLPRCFILTRIAGDEVDFGSLLARIRDTFGNNCVMLNVPQQQEGNIVGVLDVLTPPENVAGAVLPIAQLHDQLVEAIVEVDEGLMERYLEGEVPSAQELIDALPRAVLSGGLTPIFCVDAKQQLGLDLLLDGILHCLPSPDQLPRRAWDTEGNEVELKPDPDGAVAAQVFKTRIDPFVQKLSFVRVFSGTIRKDQQVTVDGGRKTAKLTQILEVQGGQTKPLDYAEAGQIVAVAKMEDLHTGSVIGEFRLPAIPFPKPMVGLALVSKSSGDEKKLSEALSKLAEEDPTLRLDRDEQSSELIITGMSELHLKLMLERLQHRDHLEVETKDPRLPLRETIQAPAEGSYRHKKQSGGRGQFGEVHIRMFPFPPGTKPEEFATKERFPNQKALHYSPENNFLWIDSIVGGTIPGNFLPAVEKGFKERMARGVIAGYPVQDVAVEVHFGKHHPVDSSEAAFKIAGSMVFRNVFREAQPCLLEPIVKLDISIPEEFVGDVYSDMSSRGGRVLGNDALGGGYQVVHAEAPLREVLHYSRTLSSMTGGQGSYTVDFARYDVMPPNVQQQYLKELAEEEEAVSA